MKEACLLILALLLGFFTSQSFGYSLSSTDIAIVAQIKQKVDIISATTPGELIPLQTKLRVILRRLSKNSREYVILAQIAKHIAAKPLPVTPYEQSIAPYAASVGDGVLRAQAALFM